MTLDLFEEPYRITISNPSAADGARIGLLLGLIREIRAMIGIVLIEDGRIIELNTAYFTVDFRYDVGSDRWRDVNEPVDGETDQ